MSLFFIFILTVIIITPIIIRRYMDQKETEEVILKYALQNAIFYKGRANKDAVLGKVMASEPELRLRVKFVRKIIEKTLKSVNKMSFEKQKQMLENIAPDLMEKKVEKQKTLPDIPLARMGKVVTRFAPSPTGPLNISQLLRAAMINFLYAKKYDGKFILRFEDTDAKKIAPEYYEWIKQDLKFVGIKWDKLIVQSKNMKSYYKTAEKLIKEGKFYVCLCPAQKLSSFKKEKKACPHRRNDTAKNLEIWKKMLKGGFREGQAVVRLKTSMLDKNPALRDPIMLRVLNQFHPLVEDKYIVWPLYNYANSLDDYSAGITHVFRGKEHEHNTTIQRKIYELLGWQAPVFINFGMIHLPGEKIHTRDIKNGIQKGTYSGWDDPRLHTVRALLRRGFHPEAFRQYAIQVGLTKTDINLNWQNLETFNRKVLDPIANRYMIIIDPMKISIEGLPLNISSVRQPYHPDFPKRGSKTLPLNHKKIYISKQDYDNLRNKEFRLKGLGNFLLKRGTAQYTDNRLEKKMQKIQWVSEPNIKINLIKKGRALKGIAEPSLHELDEGEVIQMERLGFGRIDHKLDKEITIYFAHE